MQTIIKSFEVGYNILVGLYIMMLADEYLKVKGEVDGKESMKCEENFCMKDIAVWLAGLFLFMFYHILYQNICSNCRLAARTKTSLCILCWAPLNVLLCKCKQVNFLQKVCRDKCTTPQTIGKAILMAVLSFGFKVRMDNYTATIESVEYFESWSTGLKLIMLQDDLMFALNMFLWQHFIFIGFRIAFHLLMQILFCGCFC